MNRCSLLIVGGQSDPNIARLVDQVHLRGVDYLFWDTDQPDSRRIAWDYASPVLQLDERSLVPAGVFIRHNVFHPALQSDPAIYDTLVSYLLVWDEVRVFNCAMLTDGNNKARNLRVARSLGLEIPRTLVLGDLTALVDHPRPTEHIIKPLMGGGLARTVDGVQADLRQLEEAPPQFVQERLDGCNLRIYIVGSATFAFHLHSSRLDYRDDPAVRVEEVQVDDGLLERVRALASQLGFDYCAVDFRYRQPTQSPVFLEINSSPMFVRFDDVCENRLADSIWQYLTDNITPRSRSRPIEQL